MMQLYRIGTVIAAPLIFGYLYWRRQHGKEDAARINERFGTSSLPRPSGALLWVHAVSIGEANSVLQLISSIRARYPAWQILLTTTTVTSAQLMERALPTGVMHQYLPVDTPQAVHRFFAHWQPDVGLLVESELWPNLIASAQQYGCKLALVNARMSEVSFRRWQALPRLIKPMLTAFTDCFAQTDADAERLRALGANARNIGNLKYDAKPLAADISVLESLKRDIGTRPVWLAASTHPGEEELIAEAHATLRMEFPQLLTIIVPRHPARSPEIAAGLEHAALRSQSAHIPAHAAFYIVDTLGELGLFYRLSSIAFIGGSLVPHGGQNLLEAARLSSAILVGPHMFNFAEAYDTLEKLGGLMQVEDAQTLAKAVRELLTNTPMREALAAHAQQWVDSQTGITERLVDALAPLFAGGTHARA